jgi:hypothetical protein
MTIIYASDLVKDHLGSKPMRDKDESLSIFSCNFVYGKEEIGVLVQEIRAAVVNCCLKVHEDPDSSQYFGDCALMRSNLVCGHLGAFFHHNGQPLRGMGTALASACFILRSAGVVEAPDLHFELNERCKKLHKLDGASFIAYRHIAGIDAESNVPQEYRLPILEASGSKIELQQRIEESEQEHGKGMSELRNLILGRLEEAVTYDVKS